MYSLKGQKNRRRYFIVGFLLCIFMALFAGALYVRGTYNKDIQAVSDNQAVSIVTIASGSSVNEVGLLLQEKGLIKSAWAFEWYVRSHDVRDKLQAGSYAFKPSMPVSQIVGLITTGKVATDLFTIVPGKRLHEIEAEFVKSGYSVQAVEKAFTPSQYGSHPALTDKPKEASLEGYLFPESFQKSSTTTPEELVTDSLDEMAKQLTPEIRAGFTRQGLTVHQGVTLASIVEKEVPSTPDRQKAAQVFLKRLRLGMTLGSDVSTFYGADEAGLAHVLTADTPYNTHLHTGLPPGPISNTSKLSLEAVANPASTDYLFFVAGDDGTTYFSKTLDEHNTNIKAHCKKLCSE